VRDGSLSNTRKKEEFFTLATSKLFYMRTNPEEDYILAGETARGFGSKAGWKRERKKKRTFGTRQMVLFYFYCLRKEACVDTVSGRVKTSFYFIREMQSACNAQNIITYNTNCDKKAISAL